MSEEATFEFRANEDTNQYEVRESGGEWRKATKTEVHLWSNQLAQDSENRRFPFFYISKTTLQRIQGNHKVWVQRNFGTSPSGNGEGPFLTRRTLHAAMGVGEEAGELLNSVLKADQGIRGTLQEHLEQIRDDLGDIVMFSLDLCNCLQDQFGGEWDFQTIVEQTARKVHQRNWVKNPKTGNVQELKDE